MLLSKSATVNDVHSARHVSVFQKCLKYKYLLLICLIALITLLLIHEQQERLCKENIKSDLKSIKENLNEKVQVFCLIFISQPQLARAALKVKRTWSTHCNHELFVSGNNHEVLEPLIIRQPLATTEHKWKRLRLALRYVHENHLDEAGWFLLAYENNFVVLENLRKLLEPYSPEEPISFGCKMRNKENETYTHGGTVLSHEALRRLVTVAFKNSSICHLPDSPFDDEELGRCLRNVDVKFGDTRDARGRQRFIPFTPQEYLTELKPENNEFFLNRSYYEINATTRQLSPEAILFYNVSPETIVTLYYYIYKLRIFGKNSTSQIVADKIIKDN